MIAWLGKAGGRFADFERRAYSPDGKRLYHSDTLRNSLYTYDTMSRQALQQTPTLRQVWFGNRQGRPDGGAVDAEGLLLDSAI